MEPIGERSWKQYYEDERTSRRKELEDRMRQAWDREDPEVLNVLQKGGALSFPHSYIDTSFDPLLRTVRAIHRSGKKRVLAIGVMHYIGDEIPLEFSLDGFRFAMDMARDLFLTDEIPIREAFFFRDDIPLSDTEGIVDYIVAKGRRTEPQPDDETAIVITGDLCHYGHAYGIEDTVPEYESLIKKNVERSLELLYGRRDPIAYMEHARASHNDQAYPAMALFGMLKGDLEYRIIDFGIADYSKVLDKPEPSVVASVFYGVNPK